jgi:hypothetical protein
MEGNNRVQPGGALRLRLKKKTYLLPHQHLLLSSMLLCYLHRPDLMDHTVSSTALPEKLRLPVIASLMFSEPVSSLSRGKKARPEAHHKPQWQVQADSLLTL